MYHVKCVKCVKIPFSWLCFKVSSEDELLSKLTFEKRWIFRPSHDPRHAEEHMGRDVFNVFHKISSRMKWDELEQIGGILLQLVTGNLQSIELSNRVIYDDIFRQLGGENPQNLEGSPL